MEGVAEGKVSLKIRLRNVLDSYWGRVVCGSFGLFVVLPFFVRIFDGGYTLGVYIGTGVAVLWYTVETYYLRRLAVLPIVVARIQSVQVGHVAGIGAKFAESVVLQNVGKSAALFVQVPDFDIEVTPAGTTHKRIEGVDVLKEGESAAVESAGYLNQHIAVDSLVLHLKSTAQTGHQVAIRYEDIAGVQHESVMQMGQGGTRLLSHR
jgi:hypothetical protein